MATISTTSYVLDSRKRTSGSTVPVAVFDLAALGSPIEVGTYEMLSFNSRNNVYNVDDTNDEIYYIEEGDTIERGAVLIAHGYYVDEAALIVAFDAAMNSGGGTGVYTTTYNALTNVFTTTVATATDFVFTWGTNKAQPIANLLVGYSPVNSASSLIAQTGDIGADLDPHSNLLIDITEDALKNVTLVDGTEHSLIIPLNVPYGEPMEAMKNETFNQTVQFLSPMNQLNVQLLLSTGEALPAVNAAQYELVLRRLF